MAEYRIIRKLQDKIRNNAAEVYRHKINKGSTTALAKRCNDFALLEEKCKQFASASSTTKASAELSGICSQYLSSHMKKSLSDSHSQYFLNILNEYDNNLASKLYYGAISYNSIALLAGTEYEYDSIIDSEGLGAKAFFDKLIRPDGERYVELNDLFRLSNEDSCDYIFIPVLVDSDKLCYVCSLKKYDLLSYLGLKNGIDIYDNYPVLISLLNWGITYMVSDIREDRINDLYITDVKSSEDYVRVKVSIVDKVLKEMWLPYASTIHTISNWNYERQANYGYIDFRKILGSGEQGLKVKFAEPLTLSVRNARTIRKYVELSDKSLRLVAESSKGYILAEWMSEDLYWRFVGLGEHDENILATVRFEGRSSWRLLFEKESIYYNGYTYVFRRECLEEPRYVSAVLEFYQDIALATHENADEKSKTVNNIIEIVSAQKHGTMIVFSPNAYEETERLCKCGRGIKINPIDFKEKINNQENEAREMLYNLTKIDGAIFFNDEGICYSIGTIVDGHACMHSNSGRGARFNSAYTYVNYCNERDIQCFCVVISEDETIDVFGCYGKKMAEEFQKAYKLKTPPQVAGIKFKTL